jgi:hypothetical protein
LNFRGRECIFENDDHFRAKNDHNKCPGGVQICPNSASVSKAAEVGQRQRLLTPGGAKLYAPGGKDAKFCTYCTGKNSNGQKAESVCLIEPPFKGSAGHKSNMGMYECIFSAAERSKASSSFCPLGVQLCTFSTRGSTADDDMVASALSKDDLSRDVLNLKQLAVSLSTLKPSGISKHEHSVSVPPATTPAGANIITDKAAYCDFCTGRRAAGQKADSVCCRNSKHNAAGFNTKAPFDCIFTEHERMDQTAAKCPHGVQLCKYNTNLKEFDTDASAKNKAKTLASLASSPKPTLAPSKLTEAQQTRFCRACETLKDKKGRHPTSVCVVELPRQITPSRTSKGKLECMWSATEHALQATEEHCVDGIAHCVHDSAAKPIAELDQKGLCRDCAMTSGRIANSVCIYSPPKMDHLGNVVSTGENQCLWTDAEQKNAIAKHWCPYGLATCTVNTEDLCEQCKRDEGKFPEGVCAIELPSLNEKGLSDSTGSYKCIAEGYAAFAKKDNTGSCPAGTVACGQKKSELSAADSARFCKGFAQHCKGAPSENALARVQAPDSICLKDGPASAKAMECFWTPQQSKLRATAERCPGGIAVCEAAATAFSEFEEEALCEDCKEMGEYPLGVCVAKRPKLDSEGDELTSGTTKCLWRPLQKKSAVESGVCKEGIASCSAVKARHKKKKVLDGDGTDQAIGKSLAADVMDFRDIKAQSHNVRHKSESLNGALRGLDIQLGSDSTPIKARKSKEMMLGVGVVVFVILALWKLCSGPSDARDWKHDEPAQREGLQPMAFAPTNDSGERGSQARRRSSSMPHV